MGIVYEAIQISLNRRVALKILPFAARSTRTTSGDSRPRPRPPPNCTITNIVPVFSVGCERGVHFYAMQFIEGRTLAATDPGASVTCPRRYPVPPARRATGNTSDR